MRPLILRKLRERDKWCWDCGSDQDLVPHHRRNRQMGGSKLLDRLDNLILVCGEYNGAMESSAAVAATARNYGHKLNSWSDFGEPCFDVTARVWYVLDEKGNKTATEPPSYLI